LQNVSAWAGPAIVDGATLMIGSAGMLSVVAPEYVGLNGTGMLEQMGGTNTVNSPQPGLALGVNSGSTGVYTLTGGGLSVYGQENVGLAGTGYFNQTGGTNTLSSGELYVGNGVGSTGTYTLSGGLLNASEVYVGGSGAGTFNQTGGTGTLGLLEIGGVNLPATYVLSGAAALSCGGIQVGGNGLQSGYVGLFNQSGGTNEINELTLGAAIGSTGTYNLTGTGSLLINGTANLGIQGAGIINQTGGTNVLAGGNLVLSLDGDAIGTYLLSAGSLSVSGNEYVPLVGTGIFNQSGGTNTIGSGYSLNVGGNGPGIYLLSGTGNLISPTIVVGAPAGLLSVSGGTLLASNALTVEASGTLTIQGGSVNAGSLVNSGRICLTDPPDDEPFGTVLVAGGFAQSSTGELDIALAGLTPGSQYDVLNVSGSATFAGTLDVSLADGFVPLPGDVFDIIDAGSVTGTFTTVNLPDGNLFDLTYTPTGVVLTAIPEPASMGLLTAGSLILLTRRRRDQE
jgi:hypothetical protein